MQTGGGARRIRAEKQAPDFDSYAMYSKTAWRHKMGVSCAVTCRSLHSLISGNTNSHDQWLLAGIAFAVCRWGQSLQIKIR